MSRTPRAFTLIEVLLAVFIIALGSIGLFALFAGVAEQQRRASEATRAVGIGQGAIGVLRADRVGALAEPGDPAANPPLSTPFPDPKYGFPIRDDVWYPAFVYDNRADAEYGDTLTIAPADATATTQSRFFVVDAGEVEVYSNPAQLVGAGPTVAPISGSPGVTPVWNEPAPFNGVLVTELSDRRLHPGSVRITFIATSTVDGREETLAVFDDLELLQNPFNSPIEYNNAVLTNPQFPGASVTVNYALLPWRAQPAFALGLRGFDLAAVPLQPTQWISSIRVRYHFRNDRLLSLSDRIVSVPDADAEGGRRAEFGSAIFYRRTSSGGTQVAVLTYSVRPLSRGGRFIPPERWQDFIDDRGLVRRAEVRLGYDEDLRQYYIEPIRADQGFLARTDQIILVAGDPRPTTLNPVPLRTLGADQPVRVTRVVGDPADITAARLYLSEAPRVAFRPINGRPSANAQENVIVYALADRVVSLDDRGTSWVVRPIDMRIFDIR